MIVPDPNEMEMSEDIIRTLFLNTAQGVVRAYAFIYNKIDLCTFLRIDIRMFSQIELARCFNPHVVETALATVPNLNKIIVFRKEIV